MPTDLRGEGIHSVEDLELLLYGDVVNLEYQYRASTITQKRSAVYIGSSGWKPNSYNWLYQANPGEKRIMLLASHIKGMSFENGIIIIDEDNTTKMIFSTPVCDDYETSKKLLVDGGIWEDAHRP